MFALFCSVLCVVLCVAVCIFAVCCVCVHVQCWLCLRVLIVSAARTTMLARVCTNLSHTCDASGVCLLDFLLLFIVMHPKVCACVSVCVWLCACVCSSLSFMKHIQCDEQGRFAVLRFACGVVVAESGEGRSAVGSACVVARVVTCAMHGVVASGWVHMLCCW